MNKLFIIFFLFLSFLAKGQGNDGIGPFTDEQYKDTKIQTQIIKIADSLTMNFNEQEALRYYDKILPYVKDDSVRAHILIRKSMCLFYTSKYSEAIKSIKEPLAYYSRKQDSSRMVESYNILGVNYMDLGIMDSASHYLFKSLNIVEINGTEIGKADTYNNLSSLYIKLKDYRKALHFFRKSFEIDSILRDSVYIIQDFISIGTAYYKLKKIDSAESFYLKALEMNKKTHSDFRIASIYDGLGRTYIHKGEYEKALTYLNKALDHNNRKGYASETAINLNNISNVYSKQKNYQKAIEYIKKAMKINKQLNYRLSVADNMKNISIFYAESGDYKNAYNYKNSYEQLHDSIYNENLNKKLANFEVKYKTAQKDREIAEQNLELEKQVLINKKQRYTIAIILTSVVLLAFILLIIVYYKRKTLEKNKALHKFNVTIDSRLNCPEKLNFPKKDKTAEIAAEIIEHFKDEKIITDPLYSQSKLTRDLKTNTTYISKAFSKVIKESFNDFLNRKRIALSKPLIERSNMSFIVISQKCGFNSYGSFSTSFKKFTGMTPKEYRKVSR